LPHRFPPSHFSRRSPGRVFGFAAAPTARLWRIRPVTTVTSFIFLGLIAAIVIYMTVAHDGDEVAAADELAGQIGPAVGEDAEA
jgi:hypothetical protein